MVDSSEFAERLRKAMCGAVAALVDVCAPVLKAAEIIVHGMRVFTNDWIMEDEMYNYYSDFMLGYSRRMTWEEAVAAGLIPDTTWSRMTFMSGFRRQMTWESYHDDVLFSYNG